MQPLLLHSPMSMRGAGGSTHRLRRRWPPQQPRPVAVVAARRGFAAAVAALCCCSTAAGLAVEVPLKAHRVDGAHGSGAEVLVATLHVGTPPQRILVRIDSASQATFLPGSGHGSFNSSNSSSAVISESATVPFYGGLEVIGKALQDKVTLDTTSVAQAPLLLAQNFSGKMQPPGVGVMGLVCLTGSQRSSGVPGINEAYRPGNRPGSFLEEFWETHPAVPKQYRLELGGPRPRLLLGAEAAEGPRSQGGVRFLASFFTAQSPMWYVSLRALGLSQGGAESPMLRWNHDYNAGLPSGAPALLDSGSPTIHVGTTIYTSLLAALPSGCERDQSTGATSCACSQSTWQADFPSISLSFESADTFRILGLDSGADLRVCLPAAAYVRYDNVSQRCAVAVVDSGPRRVLYGYETVILGEPFFRSAAVTFDLQRRRVGIGASPGSPNFGPSGDVQVAQGGQWQSSASTAPTGATTAQDPCPCADPKNWWSTGRRFSPRRVVVCLIFITMVAGYVYFGYSPSPFAEQVRHHAESCCPGISDWGGGDERPVDGRLHTGYMPTPGAAGERQRPP